MGVGWGSWVPCLRLIVNAIIKEGFKKINACGAGVGVEWDFLQKAACFTLETFLLNGAGGKGPQHHPPSMRNTGTGHTY